jgi:hypothetical protein
LCITFCLVVGLEEVDEVLAARGWTHVVVYSFVKLLIALTIASDELDVLVVSKLSLEYDRVAATHARELGIG